MTDERMQRLPECYEADRPLTNNAIQLERFTLL
jgi:hypothetical protein